MALIKCYKCGAEISDKASKCINCGCETANNIKDNLEEAFQKEKEQIEENFNSKLIQKETEKTILENQNKDLQNELRSEIQRRQEDDLEKERLRKEIEDIKSKNEKLENKLDTRKRDNFNSLLSKIKKLFDFLVKAFRYFWGVCFLFAAISLFNSSQPMTGFVFILLGFSFFPFIYDIIWEKVNVSKGLRIGIQMFIPFILLLASLITNGG